MLNKTLAQFSLPLLVGFSALLSLGVAARADEATFQRDLAALTIVPHRIAGSPEGQQAGAYLESRLRELGVGPVLALDVPVWYGRATQGELTVDGQTLSLHPLRPNVSQWPVTPPEGITGPLIYVGSGRPEDYAQRDPAGAWVVLDDDSGEGWRYALSLGAAGVIFRQAPGDTGTRLPAAVASVPANFLRFYAPDASPAGWDWTVDRPRVTVRSAVPWEPALGRNLIVYLPPTLATLGPAETLVVATAYDSYGISPTASPGARAAANVAALLEGLKNWEATQRGRGLVVMFIDAQAQGHAGARAVYDAWQMDPARHNTLTHQHAAEAAWVERQLQALADSTAISTDDPAVVGLREERLRLADLRSVDLARTLSRLRTEARHPSADPSSPETSATQEVSDPASDAATELDALTATKSAWDDLRRSLHQSVPLPEPAEGSSLAQAVAELDATLGRLLQQRQAELRTLTRMDRQRQDLRQTLAGASSASASGNLSETTSEGGATSGAISGGGGGGVVLQVSVDLGDATPRWGWVVGDRSGELFDFRPPDVGADRPGFYGRVLAALRNVAADHTWPHFEASTLDRPEAGRQQVPGVFVNSGSVAGAYGIPNLAAMTLHDARLRDGQPADTVANLDAPRLREQAREVFDFVGRMLNEPGLSLPASFRAMADPVDPGWDAGRSTGPFAGLSVSGDLAEDRPARGAQVALWPGQNNLPPVEVWRTLRQVAAVANFDPLLRGRVDQRGRFTLAGTRRDLHRDVLTWITLTDDRGQTQAVTRSDALRSVWDTALRVNLFPATPHQFHFESPVALEPARLSLLQPASGATLRPTRGLLGQQDGDTFFFLAEREAQQGVALFQPAGPVLLNAVEATADAQAVAGVPATLFRQPAAWAAPSAHDLHQLNGDRLSLLRKRGVTDANIETLHGRATLALAELDSATSPAQQQAIALRAAMLDWRSYGPIRAAMDDLVYAIVALLLLAIPFSYALERLLIGAVTIYGRIGGFLLAFGATFGLLYAFHPGFAIASTPLIIFLAFAILLLSILVIVLLLRKFSDELAVMQGRRVPGGAAAEASQVGTLLAAVAMGISTMRRRPTRTVLTAVTVIILTFTILCFASVSQSIGVRSVPVAGRAAEGSPTLLVRQVDLGPIPLAVRPVLENTLGLTQPVVERWWLVGSAQANASERATVEVATADGMKSVSLSAALGLMPRELQHSSALRESLAAEQAADPLATLSLGECRLAPQVAARLDVQPGDALRVNGRPMIFAGTFNPDALQRSVGLDGEAPLPIDPTATRGPSAASPANAAESYAALSLTDVVADYDRLSAAEVLVTSVADVMQLGGDLRELLVYESPAEVEEAARRLAEVLPLPVWVVTGGGVERLTFGSIVEVSGSAAVLVPLFLGGLIVFGTLLGSMQDRQREIYTFSALGLAPVHVGALFFAEAVVYAVIGGMGGQLLAQIVAAAAAFASRQGWIAPTSINFSSTQALLAVGVVMATVMVSALYPAWRASKSANPGVARSRGLPPAEGDDLRLTFPFTVSAYDITGVVSFLAHHFRQHADAGLGRFAASNVAITEDAHGRLALQSDLALAPFDLGVTQTLRLTAVPSEIPGVDEVHVHATRQSGSTGDWLRANRVFLRSLRKQFLVWRTLSPEAIEDHRRQTLELLGQRLSDPGDAERGAS